MRDDVAWGEALMAHWPHYILASAYKALFRAVELEACEPIGQLRKANFRPPASIARNCYG